MSTFSHTVTETRSPALITSAATAPARSRSEPKPSGASTLATRAISGVTLTICTAPSSRRSPERISPAVGPERGKVQPETARPSAIAAAWRHIP